MSTSALGGAGPATQRSSLVLCPPARPSACLLLASSLAPAVAPACPACPASCLPAHDDLQHLIVAHMSRSLSFLGVMRGGQESPGIKRGKPAKQAKQGSEGQNSQQRMCVVGTDLTFQKAKRKPQAGVQQMGGQGWEENSYGHRGCSRPSFRPDGRHREPMGHMPATAMTPSQRWCQGSSSCARLRIPAGAECSGQKNR